MGISHTHHSSHTERTGCTATPSKCFTTSTSNTLPTPTFSHESGFYERPFELTLQHPDPDVQIYYTLDGSLPSPHNLGGTTYRYKNHYSRDPDEAMDAFLHTTFRSHAYATAIPIQDRRHDADRIALISTTYDRTPTYFPQPVITSQNTLINLANYAFQTSNTVSQVMAAELHRSVRRMGITYDFRPHMIPLPQTGSKEYLFKNSIVRAVAEKKTGIVSPVTTRNYFIGNRHDFTLPVLFLSAQEDALFDYEHGILVAGQTYDDWVQNRDEKDDARTANWHRKKQRVAAHIEYFPSGSSQPAVSMNADISLHGSVSRRLPNKSMRLYARSDTAHAHFRHDFFDTGQAAAYSRLLLRNSGNDYRETLLKDATIHRMVQGLNLGTQNSQPAVVFLNGEYYGVFNIRERIDQHYLRRTFALPRAKIDLLKIKQRIPDGHTQSASTLIVSRGSDAHWQTVLHTLTHRSPNSPDFYPSIEQLIDLDSFIDYHITNIFIGNADWPGNNVAFWRHRTEDDGGAPDHPAQTRDHPPSTPDEHDGRWRWLLFDTDAAFTLSGERGVDDNTLEFATASDSTHHRNPDWTTFVLRTMLENAWFRTQFIVRFSDLLNTTFQPARTTRLIHASKDAIESEVPRHIHRWSQPRSLRRWHASVNDMITFASRRPAHQREHLRRFFQLGADYRVNLDVSDARGGHVRLNTLTLGATGSPDATPYPWSGTYFGGIPLTLEAIPAPGYHFSRWEGVDSAHANNASLEWMPNRDIQVRAVFEVSNTTH